MRLLAPLFCLTFLTHSAQADSDIVTRQLAAGFTDTREALTLAIENRGLVINYVSHIGDMLARTGADIGATRQIYGQAEIVEFCSAALSRQIMESDPHTIVQCPFAIAVYTLPGEDGKTWLAYRRPVGAAASLVTPLLQAIVDGAAE